MSDSSVMSAIGLAVTVLVPAVIGLVGWVWTLWQSHHSLKLKVAEDYPKAQVINELKQEMRDLRSEFKHDLSIVYHLVAQVAQRLEIPVAVEPYRR